MKIGLIIFAFIALFGDFIANEKPLYCTIDGKASFPAFQQKIIDWGGTTSDTSFYKINWATFSNYQSVLKAPIPFSAKSLSEDKFIPPFQSKHLLGTDKLGRDVLAGLIYGTKSAFWVGIGGTILSLLIGILAGLMCGYYEGLWDKIITQIINIKRMIPTLLWIFTIAAIVGKCNYFQIILIITFLSWTTYALLLRAEILKVKQQDFVSAARALGLGHFSIIRKHILPNTLPVLYVTTTIMIGNIILTLSTLSFLGVGLSIEEVTWGSMIQQASSDITVWWMAIFPGVCLFGIVYLFNRIGESLRSFSKETGS